MSKYLHRFSELHDFYNGFGFESNKKTSYTKRIRGFFIKLDNEIWNDNFTLFSFC
jgi:hypothetical protein